MSRPKPANRLGARGSPLLARPAMFNMCHQIPLGTLSLKRILGTHGCKWEGADDCCQYTPGDCHAGSALHALGLTTLTLTLFREHTLRQHWCPLKRWPRMYYLHSYLGGHGLPDTNHYDHGRRAVSASAHETHLSGFYERFVRRIRQTTTVESGPNCFANDCERKTEQLEESL
jgi:hypothetical protein